MAPDHDLVVVGDGPAGAAAAAACADLGIDVVVVGQGNPWPNRYAMWVDDAPGLPADTFVATRDRVIVVAATRHEIARSYGVIDNDELRAHLGLEERLVRDAVTGRTEHRSHVSIDLLDGGTLTARWMIDATGAASGSPPAWQSAFGVVVGDDVVRSQFTTDAVTLMDWSVTGEVPSFCYVVPTRGGWLVEETALATVRPVDRSVLRSTLARRLGEGVVADAEEAGRVEEVRIPMGLPIRRGSGRIVPFGAAAGMIHPVTGYSLGAALRIAPAIAQAIAAETNVAEELWPAAMRRSRALHDYGLAVLLHLDAFRTTDFFEAFFSLPVERWAPYLRIDGRPRDVAATMRGVFARAPWSVRRRLARLDRSVVRSLLRS